MAQLLARQVAQATATAAAIASKISDVASAESGAANVANTALNTANSASNTANNVVSTVNDVKHTFSSWDNCMSQAYCKWPVIVGIIVGSLIILSVLYCVGRCILCGAECVCCCFRCCTGGSRKKSNYEKHDYPRPGQMPYNAQYQSSAAPMYGVNPAFAAASNNRAQFATFESPSKPIHEDSLPAMPSWENANSKKVEVHEEPEAHEMNDLGANGRDLASVQPMLPHSTLSPATTPGRFDPPGAAGLQGGYGFSNQSTGALGHHDDPNGYRDGLVSPVAGYASQQRPHAQTNGSYHGSAAGGGSVYNPYHSPRNPSSPLYSSGGTTAYDPPYSDNHQRSASPYRSQGGQANRSQNWGSQQQGGYGQSQSYNQSSPYGQSRSPPQNQGGYSSPSPPRNQGYSHQSPYGSSQRDAYGPSQQGYDSGYGNPQVGRKAPLGTWRDI